MEENKNMSSKPVLIFPNENIKGDVVALDTLPKYKIFINTLTDIVLKYEDKIA